MHLFYFSAQGFLKNYSGLNELALCFSKFKHDLFLSRRRKKTLYDLGQICNYGQENPTDGNFCSPMIGFSIFGSEICSPRTEYSSQTVYFVLSQDYEKLNDFFDL